MERLELATPRLQTQCSSHWAIQLKAIAGKELNSSSWCIASLNIYRFSTVIDLSSEKYSGATGHRNSWCQWRNLQWGCQWRDSNSQPLYCKPSAPAFELYSAKLLLGRSWVYPVGVLHHYIFIISQLWLTSHLRSTVALLDTGTPGTSRETYSEYADGETRTRNPSITNPVLQPLSYTVQSYCWEGVEFIQLVYCIIIYLSSLNCHWLLIWEVQWFYWTQELLVPVENFTVRMPMGRLELATPGLQTQCSSHWAIQLKVIAGKELSLSSWCIASLYIYHYSTVIDFSSEKYSGSTGHRNSWYQ